MRALARWGVTTLLAAPLGAHALGFGDIGAFYQNERTARHDRSVPSFSTPHIDTLARDGAKLTQHYSAAPVCAPSFEPMLKLIATGRPAARSTM